MRTKIISVLVIGLIVVGFILFIVNSGPRKKEIKKEIRGRKTKITQKDAKNLSVPASLSKIFKEAQNALSQGDYLLAKLKLRELINNYPNSDKVAIWQKNIDDINTKIILGGIMPSGFTPLEVSPRDAGLLTGFTLHEVKEGDSLTKIAKQFNTTIGLIKKSNYLNKDIIIKGQKLKIWNKKFSCFVDKSQNTLLLKSGDEVIKTYIVSTGVNNSTPVGTFRIINKIENPTWYKNDVAIPAQNPENILGTRWMGFDLQSYGIHGTTDPASLGKQVTQGCVRMKNEDIEELYIFLPHDTEVTIID